MPSKLPSTEQIFTETSSMVPLLYLQGRTYYGVMPGEGGGVLPYESDEGAPRTF